MTSPPACPCGDIHELSAATRVAYENITDRGTDKRAYDWARLRDRDGKDVMDYIPLCRRCHVYYDRGPRPRPGPGDRDAGRAKGLV